MGWVLTQQTAHLFESLQEAEATKLLRLSCRTLVSRCHAISMQTFPNPWIAKKSSASLSGPLPVLVSFFAEKVEQSGTSEALGKFLNMTWVRPTGSGHTNKGPEKMPFPDFPLVATAKEPLSLHLCLRTDVG